MKRFVRFACLALVGVVALAGVALAAKDPKDVHVALVVKDLTNRFFVEMKWGGESAGKQHGIQVTVLAPEKYAVDNQIRIMEDLIQKKVDAIVIVPIDGAGIVSGIERANKARIPVFNLNTLATGGEVIGFAGIDHVQLGRIQGQWAVDTLKGKGNVVILDKGPGLDHGQVQSPTSHEGHGGSPDPLPGDRYGPLRQRRHGARCQGGHQGCPTQDDGGGHRCHP
jgi:ABC-type sugar transport system substrate-binding protein